MKGDTNTMPGCTKGEELIPAARQTSSLLQSLSEGSMNVEDVVRDLCPSLGSGGGYSDLCRIVSTLMASVAKQLEESEANLVTAAEYGKYLVEEGRCEKQELEKTIIELQEINTSLQEERNCQHAELLLWKGQAVKTDKNHEVMSDHEEASEHQRDMLNIKTQLQSELNRLHIKTSNFERERFLFETNIQNLKEDLSEVQTQNTTLSDVNDRLSREVYSYRLRTQELEQSVGTPRDTHQESGIFDNETFNDHSALCLFIDTPTPTAIKSERLRTKKVDVCTTTTDLEEDLFEKERDDYMIQCAHRRSSRIEQMQQYHEVQDDLFEYQQKLQVCEQKYFTLKKACLPLVYPAQQFLTELRSSFKSVVKTVKDSNVFFQSSTLSLSSAMFQLQYKNIACEGLLNFSFLFNRCSLPTAIDTSHGKAELSTQIESELLEAVQLKDENIEQLTTAIEDNKIENLKLIELVERQAKDHAKLLASVEQSSREKDNSKLQLVATVEEKQLLEQELKEMRSVQASSADKQLENDMSNLQQAYDEIKFQNDKKSSELRIRNAEFKSLLLAHKHTSDNSNHELQSGMHTISRANTRIQALEDTITRMTRDSENQIEESEILKRSRGSLIARNHEMQAELDLMKSRYRKQTLQEGIAQHSESKTKREFSYQNNTDSLGERYASLSRLRGCGYNDQPVVNKIPHTTSSACDLRILMGAQNSNSNSYIPNRQVVNRSGPVQQPPIPLKHNNGIPQKSQKSLQSIVQRVAMDVGSKV